MGNKASQPYGTLTSNPKFAHACYFKCKTAILAACILHPEESGVSDCSLHRLLLVTRSAFQMYDLRSGQLLRTLAVSAVKASVGVAINLRKTIAVVDSKRNLRVFETSNLRELLTIPSESEVTALRMLGDGYLVYGSDAGQIRVVNVHDGASQGIPCDISSKVSVLYHYKTIERDTIVAGFEANSSLRSSLFLFNHVRVSNPFQQAIVYEGLMGSCEDIAVIDAERLLLALTKNTAKLSVWDVENCELLLTMEITQSTQLARIIVIGEPTPTGKVRVALAGKTGLMTGVLSVTEDSVTWVQTTRSEVSKAKTQPGPVTSLEFELAMHLLVYGDDKGQVWVLDGPPPILEPAAPPEVPQES